MVINNMLIPPNSAEFGGVTDVSVSSCVYYAACNVGKEFLGPSMVALCSKYLVRRLHSRPYHSQTNGSVEQLNGVVEVRLGKFLRANRIKVGFWHRYLNYVEAQCNDVTLSL